MKRLWRDGHYNLEKIAPTSCYFSNIRHSCTCRAQCDAQRLGPEECGLDQKTCIYLYSRSTLKLSAHLLLILISLQWCGNAESAVPVTDRLVEFAREGWKNKAFRQMTFGLYCPPAAFCEQAKVWHVASNGSSSSCGCCCGFSVGATPVPVSCGSCAAVFAASGNASETRSY